MRYLGLLRVYSLVDFIMLLAAARASVRDLLGAVLLWAGFLVFLEAKHKHGYRPLVKMAWALLPVVPGVLLYERWEVAGFLLVSYMYSLKTEGFFGILSPAFRGMQNYFLVAGIVGKYDDMLPVLAFTLTFVRNLLGDLRDVEQDRKEGIETIPVRLGLQKSWSQTLHFMAVVTTTSIWWSMTALGIGYLLAAFAAQVATYRLTPRG